MGGFWKWNSVELSSGLKIRKFRFQVYLRPFAVVAVVVLWGM